jgi:hypothetical protein
MVSLKGIFTEPIIIFKKNDIIRTGERPINKRLFEDCF